MRLGVHVPVGKGLVRAARRARSLRCDCLQIFARNPRGWLGRRYPEAEVAQFRAIISRAGITPLAIHSCYLVNLASPERALRDRSIRAVLDDLARATLLGGGFVVFHAGHHAGQGENRGLRTLAASLRAILRKAPADIDLLVENSAGRGSELGSDWEQLAHLFDLLHGDRRVGVCFDTCHAHARGYRLDRPRRVGVALRPWTDALGPDRIRLIHLNDCRGKAGARQDLHEHIGQGTIGSLGFRAFLRRRELRGLCAILETPIQRRGDDRRNLRAALDLAGMPPRS